MDPIKFKYHPVDDNGQETGFFASEGELDEEMLVLDKVELPLNCIYQVISRYNRLTLVYHSDKGQTVYTIAPKSGMDKKLKETIDRLCSYRWLEERKKQLEKDGLGAAFRTVKCPSCTAVVDMTGFAETPQFYCHYCEQIQPVDGDADEEAEHYRLCDRCQLYSYPIRYTATYVVLNVISWREHFSCHVCMRKECWKMLLVNLLPPFIGEAFALVSVARAWGPGILDKYLPELVKANAYAIKGRADEARELYETMLDRIGPHDGLRYNLAVAYFNASEWDECVKAAKRALKDCSNYTPAGTILSQALTSLGQADDAEHFLKNWGVPQAAPKPAQATAYSERKSSKSRRDEGIKEA